MNVSTSVEAFPPQLAPDPYVRQQVSRSDFRTSAPDTDPYVEWYAAQHRDAVGSSSSHRNATARPIFWCYLLSGQLVVHLCAVSSVGGHAADFKCELSCCTSFFFQFFLLLVVFSLIIIR